MAVTDEKSRAYGDLSALLACACASTVADSRVITHRRVAAAGRCTRPKTSSAVFACDAGAVRARRRPPAAPARSLRVVVSDFLFPHDADALVSRLARDSAMLAIVQLTLREEAEPALEGGRRLVDVEGGGELDLVIDEPPIRDYRARFARLRLGLSQRRAPRRRALRPRRGGPRRCATSRAALAAAGMLEAA